ncbi:MAG: formylglycine-generating enzyme family protein [Chloroflexi bacterium]|nr:formylglycine-generating enzyme family protein [Chloroflexota bacterium]
MHRKKLLRLSLAIVSAVILGLVIMASTASSDTAMLEITPTHTPALVMSAGMTNRDWQPVIREIDGVEMVLVPAGCFMMGTDDGFGNDGPPHEQCIDEPFWLDRYEVTNLLFGSTGLWTHPLQPRDSATWYEAQEHCASRMGRLPTEIEWEFAARGVDGWSYPWGDRYVDEFVINSVNSFEPQVVGSRPEGESWVGALDMSGNLIEWTSSVYLQYPYTQQENLEAERNDGTFYVVRGGSFVEVDLNYLKTTSRYTDLPTHAHIYFGFRCVRNFEP